MYKPVELIDHGNLPRLGLQGLGAADWLAQQGFDVDLELFAVAQASHDCLLMRTGRREFVVEDHGDGSAVDRLTAAIGETNGIYQVPREEVCWQLHGAKANNAMAQMCGIDFRQTDPHRLIYTRVAGVSCAVRTMMDEQGYRSFRLWLDRTYGDYLWHAITEIAEELSS